MITISHGGDLGDTIYSLPTAYALAKGELIDFVLNSSVNMVREPYTAEKVERVADLFLSQPQIQQVRFSEQREGIALDQWRDRARGNNLMEYVCNRFQVPIPNPNEKWLDVEPLDIADVIIARSGRYQGSNFPYRDILLNWGEGAAFVGFDYEHEDFCSKYGEVPHYPTPSLLDLARAIAGCKLFIGNQSTPRAIAEALKVPCWVEMPRRPKNTIFKRSNLWISEADGVRKGANLADWR